MFSKLKTRIYHCRNNLLEGTGRYSKGEVRRQVSHGPVEVAVSRILTPSLCCAIAFLEVKGSIRLRVTIPVKYWWY